MARRSRNPWLGNLDLLGRTMLRAQRSAQRTARRLDPLTRAARRLASGFAEQLGETASATADQLLDTALAASHLSFEPLPPTTGGQWHDGRWGTDPLSTRHYRLFVPDGLNAATPVPLLMLLHGCDQDSADIALCTRVARLAREQSFIAVLPEQSRQANPQGCWNWFGGVLMASREAAILMQIAQHVVNTHPVDPRAIYAAGLSAGAAMALTLGLRYPQAIRAVASHSGPVPHSASSASAAARSMRGEPKVDGARLRRRLAGRRPPPLMIVQGDQDRVVASTNASHLAALWLSLHPLASASGLTAPSPPQLRQRGMRHRAFLTDWPDPTPGLRADAPYLRLAIVEGLGHAWSGGAASQRYADPRGPDALKLIWQFFRDVSR